MAKGQQKSNRERKKPKADKNKPVAAPSAYKALLLLKKAPGSS